MLKIRGGKLIEKKRPSGVIDSNYTRKEIDPPESAAEKHKRRRIGEEFTRGCKGCLFNGERDCQIRVDVVNALESGGDFAPWTDPEMGVCHYRHSTSQRVDPYDLHRAGYCAGKKPECQYCQSFDNPDSMTPREERDHERQLDNPEWPAS